MVLELAAEVGDFVLVLLGRWSGLLELEIFGPLLKHLLLLLNLQHFLFSDFLNAFLVLLPLQVKLAFLLLERLHHVFILFLHGVYSDGLRVVDLNLAVEELLFGGVLGVKDRVGFPKRGGVWFPLFDDRFHVVLKNWLCRAMRPPRLSGWSDRF